MMINVLFKCSRMFKVVAASVLLLTSAAEVSASNSGGQRMDLKGFTEHPYGVGAYFLLLADGFVYAPTVPHPDANISNCVFGACDGAYFHKQVLGLEDSEIAALESEAVEFYKTRFGIDVNAPENFGRIALRHYQSDPRTKYRVISSSKGKVPAEGWPATQIGWILTVIDPSGYELGGEFSGQVVPAGTFFSYADWVFDRDGGFMTVHFESLVPELATQMAFQYSVSHKWFGTGFGQGIGNFVPQADPAIFGVDIRAMFTFNE